MSLGLYFTRIRPGCNCPNLQLRASTDFRLGAAVLDNSERAFEHPRSMVATDEELVARSMAGDV